jgi:hypothetical protein
VRTIWNTQIHCVGRMQSSVMYTNPVRTSQGTYYVFATKPNQIMLFRETVAVYCENHMEHTNTLCAGRMQGSVIYRNPVHTSQRTHYVSTTKPNQLMLFTVRTIQNTHIHCMARMESFNVLKQVVHIVCMYVYSRRGPQTAPAPR